MNKINLMVKTTKLSFKKIFMPWEISKPLAATWGEWEDFDAKHKAKYPVRWFLFDTIPDWLGVIAHRIRQHCWALKHRFIPRHKYHIIRTSLEPGYWDPDTRILYATMDLVKEFVEETEDVIDWEADEAHAWAWSDLQAVYKWWTDKYPYRENKLPDLPDVPIRKIANEEYKDDPDVKEWKRIAEIHGMMEEQWVKEEEEMLMRVMRIRKFLWYP